VVAMIHRNVNDRGGYAALDSASRSTVNSNSKLKKHLSCTVGAKDGNGTLEQPRALIITKLHLRLLAGCRRNPDPASRRSFLIMHRLPTEAH
jgi:hypothetical protein